VEKQLWLSLAYTHVVLPHDSLSQELPRVEPTRGTGSPRRWQLRTPAMAAGLIDQGGQPTGCCRIALRHHLLINSANWNTYFLSLKRFIKVTEGHYRIFDFAISITFGDVCAGQERA
jgi:hypothetical protein